MTSAIEKKKQQHEGNPCQKRHVRISFGARLLFDVFVEEGVGGPLVLPVDNLVEIAGIGKEVSGNGANTMTRVWLGVGSKLSVLLPSNQDRQLQPIDVALRSSISVDNLRS